MGVRGATARERLPQRFRLSCPLMAWDRRLILRLFYICNTIAFMVGRLFFCLFREFRGVRASIGAYGGYRFFLFRWHLGSLRPLACRRVSVSVYLGRRGVFHEVEVRFSIVGSMVFVGFSNTTFILHRSRAVEHGPKGSMRRVEFLQFRAPQGLRSSLVHFTFFFGLFGLYGPLREYWGYFRLRPS